MSYITREGYNLIKRRLKHLWKEERPYVTGKVKEAVAMGDRSENAEYIYGKKQLREIDKKIRFLSRKLESLQVIERLPKEQSKIFFGAWVGLNFEKKNISYRIVGADETEANRDYISINAPLARALIGKKVGERVSIRETLLKLAGSQKNRDYEPRQLRYTIISISYE